ncbi:hypothetical protein BN978_04814 [Mycolicibacterium mageritense DSM 44476 = CIP 104973]|uniref:baseplate J/gp47 family protein n=1 Tax=Mycolicibacterium mageritense TaxID=53462 RepID=UPI000430B8C4|nr:baseplate J/gp47 family protein [Mycolicibacterium mageritense]CDO24318.1 hypothetical protein BN978_04814 [Mycolicibacterium mageritense DSM 44476 = CIP 104973]
MTTPTRPTRRLPTGHTGRPHAELLEQMTVAARAHLLSPAWDPTRTTGTPDHGRGLLDATALALHVLWTYQEAWADEGSLTNARLPASVWRLLALVGYHPNPGTAAQGLQYLQVKDGVTAVLPPGFRVSAPAAGDLPAATYETTRAVTVRAELNELRPFLPAAAPPPPTAGAISAAVEQLQDLPEVVVPGLQSFADVLSGRFEAGRLTTLAARNAARARQKAQQVADVLTQLRAAGAPDICGESYDALCAKLCETTELGLAVPDGLGPLSESQELLAVQLRQMTLRRPTALAGLERALARCDGEDDASYSARLDQLMGFLDALVGGILQEARDQVVRLRGTRALTVLDTQFSAQVAARGVALPGTDAVYLLPTAAPSGGAPTTQTALFTPGDWLVFAEDPTEPGIPRRHLEAVQVLRVRDETPAGLREPVTKVTFPPPLRRRYVLDRTVMLGNVIPVSHGVTTEDSVTWHRGDGPVLRPAGGPLCWLQSVSPEVPDGRLPQVAVAVAGRDWNRQADLRHASASDAAFAVEVDTAGQSHVRLGPATPDGATVRLRYRTGLGVAGNRAARAVTTIAAAHPGLVSTFNPLPMTGGADAEPAELSRARANGGIHALDRAISIADLASLAETVSGVRRARVFRDALRHRDHVTVVAAGAAGHILDDDELARVRTFLTARTAPGVVIRVLPHRQVLIRARLRLLLTAGTDPLAVLAAVRRRLGAATAAPGEDPGLLAPERAELGDDVHASDVYGALDGMPDVVSAHLDELDRADRPTTPGLAQDRVEVPRDAVAAWAGADDGLVLAWEVQS